MESVNVVRDVKRGDIRSVYPMIVEKALKSWSMLPTHTQGWVTPQDLINDGVSFTTTKAVKLFKKNRKTKFSTYLYIALDNFYHDIGDYYGAMERDESKTYSLEGAWIKFGNKHTNNEPVPMYQYLLASRKISSPEDNIISRMDIESQFVRLYSDASPLLKQYLIRWFFQPKNSYRMAKCKNLSIARKEFRTLSAQYGFTVDMCRRLLSDQNLRLSLGATIYARFRTIKHMKRDGTESFVEKHLCKLQLLNA